ncbi:MAG TPA: hypothetical protein VFW17_14360 [Ktedonobacterales bacterium]|nr:hypothetical protein [Ktedonobacterales bacterium]
MARPTSASLQKDLTDVKGKLEKAKGYIQFTRQQPQFGNFESTAKFAAIVANQTAKVGASLQAYCGYEWDTHRTRIPDTISVPLQNAINAAESSRAQIAGGIQTARAYTTPEGVLYYTKQVAGTLDVIAGLQAQLGQLLSNVQSLFDAAEQERRNVQAQQQAAKQAEEQQRRALQIQQQAVKKAEQDRKAYLAQFGGIDPDQVIAQLKAGTFPPVAAGVIPHKGETVLFITPATLSEDRTTSKYVGGSSGVSVPMGHGFRFRVGSYQGHTIRSEQLTKIDQGNFVVTTERLIFTGRKSTITIPVAKVLHTVIYKDGVDVRAENRKKREVFLCPQPLLANTFVLIACHLLSA